jgi:hypothetical protein
LTRTSSVAQSFHTLESHAQNSRSRSLSFGLFVYRLQTATC